MTVNESVWEKRFFSLIKIKNISHAKNIIAIKAKFKNLSPFNSTENTLQNFRIECKFDVESICMVLSFFSAIIFVVFNFRNAQVKTNLRKREFCALNQFRVYQELKIEINERKIGWKHNTQRVKCKQTFLINFCCLNQLTANLNLNRKIGYNFEVFVVWMFVLLVRFFFQWRKSRRWRWWRGLLAWIRFKFPPTQFESARDQSVNKCNMHEQGKGSKIRRRWTSCGTHTLSLSLSLSLASGWASLRRVKKSEHTELG